MSAPQTARERFEAWLRETFRSCRFLLVGQEIPSGWEYSDVWVQAKWQAWQAAERSAMTEAQAQGEVMRGGLDSALAEIDGLRAAIDAGDPKAELLVRVGDVRRIVSASLSTPPTAVARVIEAARELEPHLDGLICYASTTSEHEPNRLVLNLRKALADLDGGRKG